MLDVAKNLKAGFAWAAVFQAAGKLSIAVLTVVAARDLSLRDFAVLSAAQGVVLLAAAMLDFGISTLISRDVAAGHLVGRPFRAAVILRAGVFVLVMFTGAALQDVLDLSAGEFAAFAVAFFSIYLWLLIKSFVEGQLDYRGSSLAQTFGRFALLVSALGVWLSGHGSLLTYALCLAVGEAVTLVAFARMASRSMRDAWGQNAGRGRWSTRSMMFWANSVLNLGYNRADQVLVLALAGTVQAAVYAPVSAFQNLLFIVPGLLGAALPTTGAAATRNERAYADLLRAVRTLFLLLIPLSIAVAAIAALIVPFLIPIALGSDFQDSILPAQIVCISVIPYSLTTVIFGLYVALDRPVALTASFAAVFLLALAGLCLMVPNFGAVGAAIAATIREVPAVLIGAVMLRPVLKSWERV